MASLLSFCNACKIVPSICKWFHSSPELMLVDPTMQGTIECPLYDNLIHTFVNPSHNIEKSRAKYKQNPFHILERQKKLKNQGSECSNIAL